MISKGKTGTFVLFGKLDYHSYSPKIGVDAHTSFKQNGSKNVEQA
jgi:hypothetical protein